MSNFFIPIVVLVIIVYAFFKKIDVYDSFVEGASEGFNICFKMFPSLLAMILGVNIFINSGFINFLKPLFYYLKIPFDVFPIALMRPLSGSFGIGALSNLYEKYGPDNIISILASVIQGSSDTTIYIISLYFGVAGVKKIRHALWLGLVCDFLMVLLSFIIVPFLFS
ncbi:MAG: spore maturation protein [Bacilli bacterium]|nr:spore maturation protein [Bacilli bacterium]